MSQDVTLVFVHDTDCDRPSASPEAARMMVQSVRHWEPSWKVRAATVGGPPSGWLTDLGVDTFPIDPPDSDLRFVNKVRALAACAPDSGHLLFLDGDVLMCRPLDVDLGDLGVLGVHIDYPNPGTRDAYVNGMYRWCGVPPPAPSAKMVPTMYGEPVFPALNVGMFIVRHDWCRTLAERWLMFYDLVRGVGGPASGGLNLESARGYTEQMVVMPALASLGLAVTWLDARYNWNGTIAAAPNDVTFLHYHRPDVLDTDPAARRVLAEMGERRGPR